MRQGKESLYLNFAEQRAYLEDNGTSSRSNPNIDDSLRNR
jgi:hypothetical protein